MGWLGASPRRRNLANAKLNYPPRNALHATPIVCTQWIVNYLFLFFSINVYEIHRPKRFKCFGIKFEIKIKYIHNARGKCKSWVNQLMSSISSSSRKITRVHPSRVSEAEIVPYRKHRNRVFLFTEMLFLTRCSFFDNSWATDTHPLNFESRLRDSVYLRRCPSTLFMDWRAHIDCRRLGSPPDCLIVNNRLYSHPWLLHYIPIRLSDVSYCCKRLLSHRWPLAVFNPWNKIPFNFNDNETLIVNNK